MIVVVNRLFRILLLALLLVPSVGQVLKPVQEVCAGEQDCCGPNGLCDVNCVHCPCCGARAITFSSAAVVEDLDGPPTPTTPARAVAPPSVPPSDILPI